MTSRVEVLRQAIRVRVIARYTGKLALVWAALVVIPTTVCFATGQYSAGSRYIAVCGVAAFLGFAGARIRAPELIQTNEAMVIGAALFVFSPLALMWPLSAEGLSWIDAYFEAVSGVTTTGLSTVPSVENHSDSFLFARSFNQWVGGLGVVTLALALVTQPGAFARRLSLAEGHQEDWLGSTRAHFRRVLTTYCTITLGGVLLLRVLGAGWFVALLYSLAAVSTGGFAPHDASLAGLGGRPPQLLVVSLCLVCSVPLWLYAQAAKGHGKVLWRDVQVRALLIASAVTAALLTVTMTEAMHLPFADAALHGPIMAMSAQSTAGFASLDVADVDPASKLIMIFAMAVGGGAGSTAGGIKLVRALILFRVLQSTMTRINLPRHAVSTPQLGGRRIEGDELAEALTIALLFFATIAASWMAFVVSGYPPLDSLFEVTSATGTVGLSTGITSGELPTELKLVLCADMTLGRVELLALLVVFSPASWRPRRRPQ